MQIGVLILALLSAGGGNIELVVGTQGVIDIPDIARIAVGDASIADVKTIGKLVWKKTGGGPDSYVTTLATNSVTLASKSKGDTVLELVVEGQTQTLPVTASTP